MISITRFTSMGLPVVIGLSLAWVGAQIISNEKKLKNREQELQLQLDVNSIKGI